MDVDFGFMIGEYRSTAGDFGDVELTSCVAKDVDVIVDPVAKKGPLASVGNLRFDML